MTFPVIVGSERSEVGLPAGMALLCAGRSALDAVEAALRLCEDNLADHYVGTGGLPNAQGVVELDASLMVGSSRAFGAVAALQGYPHPISVARAVLERLPQHCLLVGAGADLFAAECGFGTANLLTPESRRLFREALAPSAEAVEGEDTASSAGDEAYRLAALDLVGRFSPHDGPWGTINAVALDAYGEMVVGVSTSGIPGNIPAGSATARSPVPARSATCGVAARRARDAGSSACARGRLARSSRRWEAGTIRGTPA